MIDVMTHDGAQLLLNSTRQRHQGSGMRVVLAYLHVVSLRRA